MNNRNGDFFLVKTDKCGGNYILDISEETIRQFNHTIYGILFPSLFYDNIKYLRRMDLVVAYGDAKPAKLNVLLPYDKQTRPLIIESFSPVSIKDHTDINWLYNLYHEIRQEPTIAIHAIKAHPPLNHTSPKPGNICGFT